MLTNAMTPLNIFFTVLSIAAFLFEGFALVDALRRPAAAFVAAGKRTRAIWLIILGVATVVGAGYAFYLRGASVVSILPVAAFVGAAVYMADVRPAVKQFGNNRSRSSSSGPYGPW